VTPRNPVFSDEKMREFSSRHRLPPEFRRTAEQYFLPLACRLPQIRGNARQLLLGINGAQGTGKSTLADFLGNAAESMFDWRVAVLSIDDFYYTLEERKILAKEVHPLLRTRGAPGTHDTEMIDHYLDRLERLQCNEHLALPRFDKAADDRAHKSRWPSVEGPIDLVVLEGWCVGSVAQASGELESPVNSLEREEDADGTWRNHVNDQLRAKYEPIFDSLDHLVFMRAPSFDAILRWRLEQEEKLADASPEDSSGLMNESQIKKFLQYYERLTRANLAELPKRADTVFNLNDAHLVATAQIGDGSAKCG